MDSMIEKRARRFAFYVHDPLKRLKAWKKLSDYEMERLEHALEEAFKAKMEDELHDAVHLIRVKKEVKKALSKKDLALLVTEIRRVVGRMMRFRLDWTGKLVRAHAKANGYGADDVEDGDGLAPFYSEAFLYPVLGKEDARSVLYPIERLAEMLGCKKGSYFMPDNPEES